MNNAFVEDASVAANVDKRVGDVLSHAFPDAGGPSDGLRRRVRLLAARHEERRTRRALWRRRVRAGFALVAAGAVVILALIAVPKLPAAYALSRMAEAAEDAKSAHATMWRIEENGARTKMGESWYQNKRWRKESPRDVEVYTGDVLYAYEPAANVVKVRRRGDGPFAYNASGFSVGAIARDFARWGWSDQLRYVGETSVDGRPAREVVIQRGSVGERVVLFADPKTNLPFRVDVQSQRATGDWATEQITELRYNDVLPAHFFAADFPKTARRFDVAQGEREWKRRLAPGIVRKRLGERTLVVRDLQVNENGDVFLLYTAGMLPSDAGGSVNDVELTDEFGTPYLRQWGLQPYMHSVRPHPNFREGYVLNGEALEGTWWVPATEQPRPWKPRQFTLTFRAMPTVRHRSFDEVEKALAHAKPGEAVQIGPEFPNEEPQTVTFTLPVAGPASALVPQYMPYMGSGPWNEYEIRGGEAQARAGYHQNEGRGGDTNAKRAHLEAALRLHEETIRVGDEGARASGNLMVHPDTWFAIHEALRDLGRTDEARAALQRAQDQDVYHSLDKRVAEALRTLDAPTPN